MKIYVGCAIGNLSQQDWDKLKIQIEHLKQQLGLRGHEILNFKSDVNRQAEKALYSHGITNNAWIVKP